MSNEIAVREEMAPAIRIGESGVSLSTVDDMTSFARTVINSGLAPKDFKSPEAVMIAIQHGMEIGLKPMQALHGIAVINGRPCVWGDAALAIVKSHPSFVDIVETFQRGNTADEMMAVCEIQRNGQSPVQRTFSVGDAKKANLWGKSGPWSQYPKRMLQMRARSFAMRDAFPDALKGMAVADEVADYKPAQAREIKKAEGITLPDDPEIVELIGNEPVPESVTEERDENGDFVWK